MDEMAGAHRETGAPIVHWRIILLVVAAVLGIGVLTALVITVSGADRERDRALRLQSHSYEVMILTGGLASTLRRSEEHTSALQSLMRISYAVFCLKTQPSTNTQPNSPLH